MKAIFNKRLAFTALAAAGVLSLGTPVAHAQGKTITLCWAAWDPANALVELSKDFTAKTKVNMSSSSCPGRTSPTACSTSSTAKASCAT
jgi:multiple sugar transport system substrate-binding protein